MAVYEVDCIDLSMSQLALRLGLVLVLRLRKAPGQQASINPFPVAAPGLSNSRSQQTRLIRQKLLKMRRQYPPTAYYGTAFVATSAIPWQTRYS